MNDLNYSPEAHSVLNLFYKKKYLVYVEGQDDKLFWKKAFQLCGIDDVKIEEVGSCTALDKKSELIRTHDSRFIVARDNDHRCFMQDTYLHARIIYTYGYSIENTLYCVCNLNRFVQNLYRITDDVTQKLIGYITQTEQDLYELLVYDIGNMKFQKSISVFGDSCFRFLKKNKDYFVDSQKVNDFIASISQHFTNEEINVVRELIIAEGKNLRYLIKGHFLTNIIVNYIKFGISRELSKDHVQLSNNFFYTSLIDGCMICGNHTTACQDREFINDKIRTAIESLCECRGSNP